MKKFIAALLAAVTTFSVTAFSACDGADTGNVTQKPPSGNLVVDEEASNGLTLAVSKVANLGIEDMPEEAENAVVITATVTPSVATNPALDWSVSFVDANSEDSFNAEWAVGKKVTDYVDVITDAAEPMKAMLVNYAAFSEKIKVTATSQDNPNASASIVCGYMPRVLGFEKLTIGGQTYATDERTGEFALTHFWNKLRPSETGDTVNYIQASSTSAVLACTEGTDTISDVECTEIRITFNDSFVNTLVGQTSSYGFSTPEQQYITNGYIDCFVWNFGNYASLLSNNSSLEALVSVYQSFDPEYNNVEMGTIKIYFQYLYGNTQTDIQSYWEEFPILIDPSCTIIPVEGVTLEAANYNF